MQQSDELEALLRGLPPDIAQRVRALEGLEGLLEIVMDLGRLPEARFAGREDTLARREVSAEDLAYVISHIGQFGGDNRAGIERTLHRISALRNRAGKVVGLTLRVGRAVYGTMEIMPEVVVIDEIGTEQEAAAARTIAERGVQLIATAHGNTLENLMLNPTLSDLVGGVQTVTLGDEEARRRGTQKSVLERKAPPTFQTLVEIQAYQRVALYQDVAQTVDAILLGSPVAPEIRSRDASGELSVTTSAPSRMPAEAMEHRSTPRIAANGGRETVKVYPFGLSWTRVEEAARGLGLPVAIVREPDEADVDITLKNYYRRKTPRLRNAESQGIPIYIARSNSSTQIASALASVIELRRGPEDKALEEARDGIEQVVGGQSDEIELAPQNAYVRKLQHELVERANLSSRSTGHEPFRRVQIYR